MPWQGTVAESVECMLFVRKVGSFKPIRDKRMSYKIDRCYYLALGSALLGQGKYWLAQY